MADEALTAAEVKELIKRKVSEMLEEHPDLSNIYAYPRVKWEISIKVTPYYEDEAEIKIDAVQVTGHGTGREGKTSEIRFRQEMVTDPDSLRISGAERPAKREEFSEKPGPLNPMVRLED